jgi:hypothetical protein
VDVAIQLPLSATLASINLLYTTDTAKAVALHIIMKIAMPFARTVTMLIAFNAMQPTQQFAQVVNFQHISHSATNVEIVMTENL